MTDLEGFVAQEGREELIAEVRRRIDAEGITYIYYQFVSVTGRIMGKGVPAPHWETIARKGFQLVYGSTANLFIDRRGDYIGYGPEARELIGEVLRTVGLRPEEILGRFPHQLSGGQRQRVMVARALLLKPKLIVADEPVSMVDASLRATILGSLRRLTDEHGISILYITHDLATAYQVSDSILVLYRAHVAEAGAVERVVTAPRHPYTQLLISAIPRARATRDWLAPEEDAKPNGLPLTAVGCRFADRCPQAMPACLTAPPGLYRTEPRRAVACVQFRHHPPLPAGALGEVLSA